MSRLYPYPCFALGKDLLKLCSGAFQGSVKICCAVGTGQIGSVDSSCVVTSPFCFSPFCLSVSNIHRCQRRGDMFWRENGRRQYVKCDVTPDVVGHPVGWGGASRALLVIVVLAVAIKGLTKPYSRVSDSMCFIYTLAYGQYIFTDCTEDNVQNTHTYCILSKHSVL